MKNRLILTFLLFFCSFFLFSQKTGKIIIIHTNDMHSKIDNMGKLAYLVDSLKKLNPYVFLVSSGDNFTGNPVVDMIRDKGYPMIDLMNRCGFNLSAYGNHEFDMGQDLLAKRIQQAKFPFISCNIHVGSKKIPQPEPFVVIDAGNLAKIAFLSAIEINEDSIPDTHPTKVEGIKFSDGISEMKKYSDLKEKYGILLGVTHLGILQDIKLAEEMPSLDVIFGGHSHTLIDTNFIVNGVRITQAGNNLNYAGKTTLEISDGKVVSSTDEVISLKNLKKSDTEIQTLIDKYNDVEEFKKVIGCASKPLSGYDEIGSMMTDAVRNNAKTDFSFQNQGGIRITSIDSGNITIKDIYRLDPFGNKVAVYKMNREDIISLIKYGYELEKVPDLMVSGMKYTIHTDKEGNCRDIEIFPDVSGQKDSVYLVSMNGYMAAAYKFTYREKVSTSDDTTSEILIKYLKKKKEINYQGVKRVTLISDR